MLSQKHTHIQNNLLKNAQIDKTAQLVPPLNLSINHLEKLIDPCRRMSKAARDQFRFTTDLAPYDRF